MVRRKIGISVAALTLMASVMMRIRRADLNLESYIAVYAFSAFLALLVFGARAIVEAMIMAVRSDVARSKVQDGSVCRVCGYDMRATPERCPECGTVLALGASSPEDQNASN